MSGRAIPPVASAPSCGPWPSIHPKGGRPRCWPRMRPRAWPCSGLHARRLARCAPCPMMPRRSSTCMRPATGRFGASSAWLQRARLQLSFICTAGIRRAGCRPRPSGWTESVPPSSATLTRWWSSTAWKDVLEPMIGPVEVVPNPVHPMHRPAEEGRQESERLLVMGRDAAVKRRDFALDVLASVRQQRPSVHLHLTGGQPLEGDGWTRHGWLSEAERLALLHNSSAVLLPSRFEGQPLAALEALACGVPVIADADLVGLPETVVRPTGATVEAWTTAVLETLSAPADTAVLSASVAHHAVEHVASRWTEVYAMAFERRAA